VALACIRFQVTIIVIWTSETVVFTTEVLQQRMALTADTVRVQVA